MEDIGGSSEGAVLANGPCLGGARGASQSGSFSQDGDTTTVAANGENGASDADVSSLSSLDGACEESQIPSMEHLKNFVGGYRKSRGATVDDDDRQSSVSSYEGQADNSNVPPDKEVGKSAAEEEERAQSPRRHFQVLVLERVVSPEDAPGNNSASTSPEAILHLNGMKTPGCGANTNCKPFPLEDTHEFNSNSAAAVTCELKTEGAQPFNNLQEELRKAQEVRKAAMLKSRVTELKVKDEEVGRLKCLRDEVGAELEDLTASLFQEAHKMVREAKVKRDAAEKALKEANMKIEVLQAEVQALKALVITSTPSMPNRHLHPQLDSKGAVIKKENGEKTFFKGHRRSPSHNNLKYGRETTPPGSPVRELPPEPVQREEYEVDPVYHHEFVSWKEKPCFDKEHPFLARIYREDILPCLNFNNSELSKTVQKCIEDNSIVIETVSGKSPFPKRCAMLDTPRLCKYRMKLGESDQWHYISELCRNRIAATCNFLSYLRYIQQGLVKSSIHEVYGEILHLRKQIAVAKLGFN